MNRLIIIGNGFDLAHGMKTGYCDFIKWYLNEIFQKILFNSLNDDAITAPINPLLNSYINQYYSDILIGESNHEILERIAETIKFKLPFLKKIILKYSNTNWVNIENEFYVELLKATKIENEIQRGALITSLNASIDYIKLKLEVYLKSIAAPNYNPEIVNIMNSSLGITRADPLSTMILNFNYTRTILPYVERINTSHLSSYGVKNIFIHGEIHDSKNPMVFGFGDEMDEHYQTLEKMNDNRFLNNMKSFGYFFTENYHELNRFIKMQDFEVFIMGHSCGLSDRVMLNMIFEEPNCRSIKVFYHETESGNNYKELTQEISRHFNKKNMMRIKLVSFPNSLPLPQSI